MVHPLPPINEASRGRDGSPRPEALEELLLRGSAQDVLARIVEGDPLELRARSSERMRRRDLILDTEGLLDRVRARVAWDAVGWRGTPRLGVFLGRVIERVLDERELPGQEPAGGVFCDLGRVVGLEPLELREACLRFNRFAPRDRARLRALVFDGTAPEVLARREGGALVKLHERLEARASEL